MPTAVLAERNGSFDFASRFSAGKATLCRLESEAAQGRLRCLRNETVVSISRAGFPQARPRCAA